MTKRTNWFASCVECASTEPNAAGICASCEEKHGYADPAPARQDEARAVNTKEIRHD